MSTDLQRYRTAAPARVMRRPATVVSRAPLPATRIPGRGLSERFVLALFILLRVSPVVFGLAAVLVLVVSNT